MSEIYTRDYNEIKDIGSVNSTTRTAEQSQIATFWRASPTAIWNPVIRQVVAARKPDLSATARTYALIYLTVADASVACWDAKYAYNFWRPQASIRRGDEDGNSGTSADPTWTPFVPTPPHPEYPSGHATNSSAMAAVLGSLFDDYPGIQIEVTISGITRRWDTFSAAVSEVIDARVYSGIHFRNSDEVGARQGRQVAQFVMRHALRPCIGEGARCR
jgi:membrane-associated phospholipid phosphatase